MGPHLAPYTCMFVISWRAPCILKTGLRLLESAPNSNSASAQLAAVDLKVAMAECLLESGRAQEAADLTIAALAAPEHAGRNVTIAFRCNYSVSLLFIFLLHNSS